MPVVWRHYMQVHLVTQLAALSRLQLSSWIAVVVDAVRASSTIACGVAGGCRRIVPVGTIEEAHAWKEANAREMPLLCGERGGLKIPGFDLGNSPREYVAEAVRGRSLVLTTTNGTRAIGASLGAREVIIGAFVNLPAVAAYLETQGGNVVIVPAGREGKPVLDDVVCAGMYVDRLLDGRDRSPTDEASLARMAFLGYRGRILDALKDSPSGQALLAVGFEDDLVRCAEVGSVDSVPAIVDGEIRDKGGKAARGPRMRLEGAAGR